MYTHPGTLVHLNLRLKKKNLVSGDVSNARDKHVVYFDTRISKCKLLEMFPDHFNGLLKIKMFHVCLI